MNCERYGDYILLRDSGELGKPELADLERHLDQCADCAEAVKTLAFVRAACGESVQAPATPPSTVTALQEAARLLPVRIGSSSQVGFRAIRVLAWAAILILVLGVTIRGFRNPITAPSGADNAEVAFLVSPEDVDLSLEVVESELAGIGYELDSTAGLEEMANEILSMEGEQA